MVQVNGKCFDIICPPNMDCYENSNWFSVPHLMPKRTPC